MPMNAEAPRNHEIEMKCSYEHGKKLYIYFELSSYHGLPLTTWAMESGPLVQTDTGAYRYWKVHVGEHPCIVQCSILDRHGIELAMITTTVTPGWETMCHGLAMWSCAHGLMGGRGFPVLVLRALIVWHVYWCFKCFVYRSLTNHRNLMENYAFFSWLSTIDICPNYRAITAENFRLHSRG